MVFAEQCIIFGIIQKKTDLVLCYSKTMRIIGIDPGYAIVGYGIIDKEDGKPPLVHTYGCIKTEKNLPSSERLITIYQAITNIIITSQPTCMAIEQLFFARNTTTALQVSEARGVLLLAAAEYELSIFEYSPNQIKQAITGSGRADKKQIQTMITRLLGLSAIPRPDDAADGLAIALCHLNWIRTGEIIK